MEAGSEKESCRAYQRVGSTWQYLGLKDDPQKRRMVGKDRGLWRCTKFHIINGSIYQLIGKEKWAKNQLILKKCLQRVVSG